MLRYCLLFLFSVVTVSASPKKIKVFVALCDNATQGIAPVGKSIGDGDKPEANLYWGCSDGLPKVFGKSKLWKRQLSLKGISDEIMREVQFEHKRTKSKLIAVAYRGSAMKQCYLDFEKTVASGEYDFVAFIGHNALMDFTAKPIPQSPTKTKTKVAVLCCLSDRYCSGRIRKMGGEPVLMTKSLMYPGAFILHDAFEQWFKGGDKKALRAAAGKAYLKNQKKLNPRLGIKGATGVFAVFK